MVAPNFTLKDMHSNEERSLEDYKGKALLLTFWVSGSSDCQRDLANKEQLYKSMKKDDLEMLMIDVTGLEDKEGSGESYYVENNFTFPTVKDEGTKVYDTYQCMSVPTTFLLNKQHDIVGRFNERASFQQMVKEIGMII